MECSHINIKEGTITFSHLDEKESVYGNVCVDCGAEQWTPELIQKYEQFKKKTEKHHSDRLKVQNIFLTANAKEFIKQQCEIYATEESKVVKALLSAYFHVVQKQGIGETLMNEAVITDASYKISAVRLGSVLYNQVKNWSEVLDVGMGRYVGEIINRIVYAMNVGTEEQIRAVYDASIDAAA